MQRAESWIRLNPEMNFILWTDLDDKAELLDFLSQVPAEHAQHFTSGRVTIKYLKDTVEFVMMYLQMHKDKDQIKNLDATRFVDIIKNKDNSRVLIAKTDYLRAMILHHYGGFYVDFNDCECFLPIKFWFNELVDRQQLILPCDTFNESHVSNYFIYVPKGSKIFEDLHLDTLTGFEGIMKVPPTKMGKLT